MKKRKIYFRADAGANIGYGHFIRTLALADMLKENFDCSFFTQSPTPYQLTEVTKTCPCIALDPASKLPDFLERLKGDETVVLDNYFFTSDYQKLIKEKGCSLVCIDDMHDKHYYADLVINHTLTDKSLFDVEPYTTLCLGLEYALLREPFIKPINLPRKKGQWFVSFGGSDYLNLTEKFVSLLQNDPGVSGVTVVVGDAYRYKDRLSQFSKADVKNNLSALEMSNAMCGSEYAVLPCSGVAMEALACGCKLASGYYVENQKECYIDWLNKDYIVGLDNLESYNGTSFINLLHDKQEDCRPDFSEVPGRLVSQFINI